MVNALNYILKGFGYRGASDFKTSVFKLFYMENGSMWVLICTICGALRTFVIDYTGLDATVFLAFITLIGAEFITGIKVSILKRGERFKSRKFGRMILKIGVFVLIIMMLHAFAKNFIAPEVLGFQINPFMWLYYTVFIAIVFQLFISWLENLGALGYKETRTIAGLILRKFNKWFEFDGSKDNGQE